MAVYCHWLVLSLQLLLAIDCACWRSWWVTRRICCVTLSPSLRSPGFGTVHLPLQLQLQCCHPGSWLLQSHCCTCNRVSRIDWVNHWCTVVSTVTTAFIVPTLPAGLSQSRYVDHRSTLEAYCPPGTITIVRRWIVHTIDSPFAVGSFTVPVNAGVLSLLSLQLLLAQLHRLCLLTEVACRVSCHCCNFITIFKRFGTVHLPSGPATTVAILGKLPSLLNLVLPYLWQDYDRINHWCIWCCSIYCIRSLILLLLPAASVNVTFASCRYLQLIHCLVQLHSMYLIDNCSICYPVNNYCNDCTSAGIFFKLPVIVILPAAH